MPTLRSFNTVVEQVVSSANEGEAGAVASANNGGVGLAVHSGSV